MRYPIDFDGLSKGDVLSAETISVATMQKPGTKAYSFAMLRIQSTIRERRPDLQAHVKCEGDTIRILNDLEADEHTWRECVRGQAIFCRNTQRRAAIDRVSFDATQLRIAEAKDRTLTRTALQIRKEILAAQREARLLTEGDK